MIDRQNPASRVRNRFTLGSSQRTSRCDTRTQVRRAGPGRRFLGPGTQGQCRRSAYRSLWTIHGRIVSRWPGSHKATYRPGVNPPGQDRDCAPLGPREDLAPLYPVPDSRKPLGSPRGGGRRGSPVGQARSSRARCCGGFTSVAAPGYSPRHGKSVPLLSRTTGGTSSAVSSPAARPRPGQRSPQTVIGPSRSSRAPPCSESSSTPSPLRT